jgi:hypothetical protein
MRQLHAGAQRHLHEVRHLRIDDGVFVTPSRPARALTKEKEIFLNDKSPKSAQADAEAKFKRKEMQARDGVKAMAEYEAERVSVRQKTARLRALRLAKEAADAKAVAAKGETGKKKGK